MSTTARPLPVTARRDAQETDAVPGGWEATARLVLSAFASLRLTVTLFALSCVIVLVGTLAQEELNMLEVKQRYFTSWIAMMRLEDFVPQAFIRHEPFTFEFPFPGGATIGLLLLVNLVAAKLTRFSVHARGTRLASGIAVLAAGFGLTALVISAGHSAEGLQGEPPFSYDLLWAGVAGATAAGWVGAVGAAIASRKRGWRILWITAAAVIGVTLLIVFATGFRLGDPGLRILWQLIKGLGAAAVLLIGCNLVFGPRGGNVLLHFGVGLLMIGQFAFGDRQLEQRLNLIEGDSTNTLINLDAVELAIIDRSNPAEDRVISVPSDRLRRAVGGERTIRDEALPFDLQVLTFYDNSDLLYDKSDLQRLDGENLADAGVGLKLAAVPTSKTGGVDSKTNLASAYVRLLDKQSGEPLGTHLVSQWLSDRTELVPDGSTGDHFDTVTVGGQAYDLGLRFKRIAKPYWVKLQEVRRIDYSGTSTARDFSSFIRLVDTETGEDRLERVWMNNPLRYRGETFYQSQYTPLDDGRKMTGIQVVRNSGWLIPYVACAIVGLGMLAHFSGTLNRFLGRREREERRRAEREALRHWGTQRDPKTGGGKKGLPPLSGSEPGLLPAPQGPSRTPVVLTVVGFGLLALLSLVPWQTVRSAIRPEHRQTNMDFYRAGEIPVRFGGRVMPLDAYARQTLKAISNKESLPLENAPKELQERGGSKRRLAALPWLMEVANDSDALRYLPMFRIDSDEVLAEFDLKRNQDKLYSLDQLRANYPRFRTAADAARKKDEKAMTFKEKKLLELDRRLGHFDLTSAAFQLPRPQPIPEHLVPPEHSIV